jgi:hypothetical protein
MTAVITKLGWGATAALLIALALYVATFGKWGPGAAGMLLSAGFAAMQRAREKMGLVDAAILGGPGVAGGGLAAWYMG